MKISVCPVVLSVHLYTTGGFTRLRIEFKYCRWFYPSPYSLPFFFPVLLLCYPPWNRVVRACGVFYPRCRHQDPVAVVRQEHHGRRNQALCAPRRPRCWSWRAATRLSRYPISPRRTTTTTQQQQKRRGCASRVSSRRRGPWRRRYTSSSSRRPWCSSCLRLGAAGAVSTAVRLMATSGSVASGPGQ